MSSDRDYESLVAKATKAVAGVKDADLKQIAFQKVLDDLLSNDGGGASTNTPKAKATAPKAAKKSTPGGKGPKAYVEELVEDSFFSKKPKTIAEVKAELENRGHHIPITSLSGPMQRLCQEKKLRRQKLQSGIFAYSEW